MDFKGLLPTSSTLYFFIYYHFSNNQSFRIVASLTTWRRQWYPSRLFPTLRMTKKANQWWPWARIPPPPFPQSGEQNCSSFGGNSNLQKWWQGTECLASIYAAGILSSLPQHSQNKMKVKSHSQSPGNSYWDTTLWMWSTYARWVVTCQEIRLGCCWTNHQTSFFHLKATDGVKPSYWAVGACAHVCWCTPTLSSSGADGFVWDVLACFFPSDLCFSGTWSSLLETTPRVVHPSLTGHMFRLCYLAGLAQVLGAVCVSSEHSLVIKWLWAMAILPPHGWLS